jgi:hypothetical protein
MQETVCLERGGLKKLLWVEKILQPVALRTNDYVRREIFGTLERRRDGGHAPVKAPHRGAGPNFAELSYLDLGACFIASEPLWLSAKNPNASLIQIVALCEFIPINVDRYFRATSTSGREPNAPPELVCGESADTLLTERQAVVAGAPNPVLTLQAAVVRTRFEPDFGDGRIVHPISVVRYNYASRVRSGDVLQ